MAELPSVNLTEIEKMKVIFTHPQKVNILNLVEKYRDNRCYIFSSLDEMQQFMLE